MVDCDNPYLLPEKELSQSESEYYWGLDRSRLVKCKGRHAGLKQWAHETTAVFKERK